MSPNAQRIDQTHGCARQPQVPYSPSVYLLRLGSGISLGPEVGRGRATREEAANKRLEERVEDNLSTAGEDIVSPVLPSRGCRSD
jgi:hypothetical protein